ncbi:MAG: RIP metalloprotease RseP [Clostridia bacterium]|nr:RIP metalloprotease RseP [Clostridia bacterium]
MDFSSVISKVLPFVIAVLFFGLIIFIHEFGHFIFAKLFGVKVNEFAIGMGPTVLKKQGKETKYALRLLPFGGFVSMEGEEEKSEDSRAFCNQKVWKRMIIISAGAVMNLILGFIVCIFLVSGSELVGTNEILQFYEGAVSSESGLAVGDKILEIDGKKVYSDYDISFLMQRNSSGKYDFLVEREGEKIYFEDVTFAKRTSGNFYYRENCSVYDVSALLKDQGFKDEDIILNINGKAVKNAEELIAQIDADKDFTYDFTLKRGEEKISLSQVKLNTATVFDFSILGEEKNVLNVLSSAFGYSISMGRMVYLSLFDLLRGQYGLNDLAGPIGTVTVIADIAQSSIAAVDWSGLFMMMAMITINIGLFNLLPVPALDGGHLFFMVFEIIFRKPVPQKYESWIHAAGLIILLAFMAVISFSDIWKLVSGRGFY